MNKKLTQSAPDKSWTIVLEECPSTIVNNKQIPKVSISFAPWYKYETFYEKIDSFGQTIKNLMVMFESQKQEESKESAKEISQKDQQKIK